VATLKIVAVQGVWEGDVVLADGGTVHVRPITPADSERLIAFHSRLSAESIYYRYFSPKPRLSEKEVENFTTVDFVDRAALVAVLAGEIVAVARFDRWPGTNEAEVAFLVDDGHQGRGISTLLLEHLVAIALEQGVARFTAEVLPDNRAMLGVFRRAGFEVSTRYSSGIIDVSFDIDPTPAFVESVEQREQRAESRSIARLLHPRSIAVIGASNRVGSVGHAVLRNLVAGGFDGPVYAVNPSVPHAMSMPTYASVLDIPDDVHLALVAVPRDGVVAAVEQCAEKNVRSVVVIATGFSDAGPEGAEAERELVALARGNGMRLVGPASMGLISTTGPGTMVASFGPVAVRPGRVAISLQSGPLASAVLHLADRLGVGISSFVSLGNKADVSANDLLNHWQDDPDTDVVLLYTETFGNPRKFGRVARRVSRQKPIVAVKANRSGDDVAVDALYEQAGVIRVDTVRQLVDVGRVLAGQPRPAGDRIAVVTNAASPAALALDGFVAAGLRPAAYGEGLVEAVRALGLGAVVGTAIDLTHRATPEDYDTVLRLVLADAGVDGVVVIHAPPIVAESERYATAIARASTAESKPVVAVMLGQEEGRITPDCSLPVFAFAEPAVDALGRAVRYGQWQARPEGRVTVEPVAPDKARAAEIGAAALVGADAPVSLSEADTVGLLRAYGIRVPASGVVTSCAEAVAAASQIGYPVALKVLDVPVRARSESGGVALDVQDADELRGCYERMTDVHGVSMQRSLVQAMVPGGVETIVTVTAHPSFGPVISFGLGGAFADAIADRSTRAVPLTDVDAEEMITSSRGSRALAQFGIDREAVVDLLLRLSHLVDDLPAVSQVRLNPVLVSADAAWVLAAAVEVAPLEPGPGSPLRRLG
jgi:acyl-CoA synthetase (NDP forming)/RimJ/RimL family protein N-acetyltransferase